MRHMCSDLLKHVQAYIEMQDMRQKQFTSEYLVWAPLFYNTDSVFPYLLI